MKSLLLSFLFLLPLIAFSETITSKIYKVEEGLLYLENGRVVFLDGEQKSLPVSEGWVQVRTDKRHTLLGIQSIPSPRGNDTEEDEEGASNVADKELRYTPTNLGSTSEASGIFRSMRRDYQYDSQCYNRAMVWAYEAWQDYSLNSMKLFMFFTRRYIYNYRYQWWFHVTPMTYVNGTAMTLDRRFTRSPLTVKNWTDKFIYSRATCPVVSKYTDYSQHQQEQDCYLIPVSMYFWQPRDIETRDRTGYEKTSFQRYDVNWAYNEAF